MSAHILLNLTYELKSEILFIIWHKITLKSYFMRKKVIILSLCTQHCYGRHNVSRKSVNH